LPSGSWKLKYSMTTSAPDLVTVSRPPSTVWPLISEALDG
jgi:hypothetical protein